MGLRHSPRIRLGLPRRALRDRSGGGGGAGGDGARDRAAPGALHEGGGRRAPQDRGVDVSREPATVADDLERDSIDAAQDAMDEGTLGRLASPRTLVFIFLGIVVAIVGLYVLLPKLVGVSDAFNRIGDATWYWIVVAFGFVVVAFGAYAAVFKAVVGGGPEAGIPKGRLNLRASYEITMAGFAGSTFFSAGGAGGLIIIYWALRKAGMEARRAACRMVALLVLLYAFYALALIVFGILLYTGVLSGPHPTGGTLVPAAVAAVFGLLVVAIALIPQDVERRI